MTISLDRSKPTAWLLVSMRDRLVEEANAADQIRRTRIKELRDLVARFGPAVGEIKIEGGRVIVVDQPIE